MNFSSVRNVKFFIAIAAGIVVLVLGAGCLSFLRNTSSNPQAEPTAQTIAEAAEPYIDALMRSWAVVEVCYDANTRQYLFKVAPHPNKDDTLDEGWYITTSYKFSSLSNGSVVLVSSTNSYKIFPDVSGLPCKQQAADPSWFKD